MKKTAQATIMAAIQDVKETIEAASARLDARLDKAEANHMARLMGFRDAVALRKTVRDGARGNERRLARE